LKKEKTGKQLANGIKKTDTVARILTAAKKVFSEYPYRTASIRMIGNSAGLNFPLIAYYFPTKAVLFEKVLSDLSDEYYEANAKWLNETACLGSTKGLSLYLDRLIDFTQKRPEALRIVLLNLVQAKESETIPCYQTLQIFFARMIPLFKKTSSARAADKDIEMFHHNINTLAINYLGAGIYYAGIMGLDPDSSEYRQSVKENLMSLFLPILKKLVRGGNQDATDQ